MATMVAQSYYLRFVCLVLCCTSFSIASPDVLAFTRKLSPSATRDEKVFTHFWTIESIETMVWYDKTKDNLATPVVFEDGKMKLRNARTCRGTTRELNETERESVVVGDGSHRRIYTINRSIPGPRIVVYEGTQVVIHVKNELITEGVTIHWHGLEQHKTPWMDGVPRVTQCPINPGETFTYRFMASRKGTYWYHSHLGGQRSDGLYGPLVVLDPNETYPWESENATFTEEFMMMVQDWSRYETSNVLLESVLSGLWRYKDHSDYGNVSSGCYDLNFINDGSVVSIVPQLSSVIVNGNGRYFPDRINPETPDKPYDTYDVQHGKRYKFRVVNAAFEFAMRVSIDEHDLMAVASDGQEFSEIPVQYIVVSPGERMDFYINTTQKTSSYWIRTETLEVRSTQEVPVEPLKHFSILRYSGATGKPNSTRTCIPSQICKILNCPFGSFLRNYAPHTGLACVHLTRLTANESGYDLGVPDNKDIFLNWHFSRNPVTQRTRSTVNGHRFVFPSEPPLINPGREMKHACNKKECEEEGHCKCTYWLPLEYNSVVQIVFYNYDTGGMPHPVHMHGFFFYVLKEGYATYDENGTFVANNKDLVCVNKGTKVCIEATWAPGHPTGLNTKDPILKDTIVVPAGGYVVVRFKADNPGWWFLHCHVEDHADEGMALLLKVGSDKDMPAPPKGFKNCGDFTWSESDFDQLFSGTKKETTKKKPTSGADMQHVRIPVIVILLSFIFTTRG